MKTIQFSGSNIIGFSAILLVAGVVLLFLVKGEIFVKEYDGKIHQLPGAAPFSANLQQQLYSARAAKGTGYKPRTQYLGALGEPLYTNRLIVESSTYLQQHAHNPVNWFSWGEEAFSEARRLNRPVLVSIGYSTCHWCHVMEEESFDDEETAEIINKHFIAIKVDREVRPDVDEVYMTALQAMGKQGGWPLNVWLTADQKPFFGGTYFPPEDRYGRPGFKGILQAVYEQYGANSEHIEAFAEKLTAQVKDYMEGQADSTVSAIPDLSLLQVLRDQYVENFDWTWGGLTGAPKFPSSLSLNALMHAYKLKPDKKTLQMFTLTLDKMANGGIYDQIGGGFHRYSTDERWLVPHFEKMLYDNAQLTSRYLQAWLITYKPRYKHIVVSTLDYVLKEMTSVNGGFFSATDADSVGPSGEMEEGYYFSWTLTELQQVLTPEQVRLATLAWGIEEPGNFEGRSLPQAWFGESTVDDESVKRQTGVSRSEFAARLEEVRVLLLAARQKRSPPLRDEKQLTAWNGLMISAFAKAGFHLKEPRYVQAAEAAAQFIARVLVTESELYRVYQHGSRAQLGFLGDYAFYIAGLLDVYEATHKIQYLNLAIKLQKFLDNQFSDVERGGYFRSAHQQQSLFAREKNQRDGALPSGNSVALLNVLRLYEYTLNPAYIDFATRSLKNVASILSEHPAQLAEMMEALHFYRGKVKEIVLVGDKNDPRMLALLDVLRKRWLPNSIVLLVSEDEVVEQKSIVPLLAYKKSIDGVPTAYVCFQQVCELPTSDPMVLAEQLSGD